MGSLDVKTLFGKRLRKLRKERGWSQEQFADRAGLYRSYVGGVERGERNVSLENICLIADTLGTPPASLFLEWAATADCPDVEDANTRAVRNE
ncbi:MAG: helix-turn-helix transcriptional regulator [Isosphaeraceae bacterium]